MTSNAERTRWLYQHRNKVLSLEDLHEVGTKMYGRRDAIGLYGMSVEAYFESGVRILGRTAIECCVDARAKVLAQEARRIKDAVFPGESPVLVDLFAGSCNLLFHVSTAVSPRRIVAFERDDGVHRLSKRNLELIGYPCEFHHGDYSQMIRELPGLVGDAPCIFIVSPPWGKGFNYREGLDLHRTEPPVGDVIDDINASFPSGRCVVMIQTHKKMMVRSMQDIASRFDRVFNSFDTGYASGVNIGFLSCTNSPASVALSVPHVMTHDHFGSQLRPVRV